MFRYDVAILHASTFPHNVPAGTKHSAIIEQQAIGPGQLGNSVQGLVC